MQNVPMVLHRQNRWRIRRFYVDEPFNGLDKNGIKEIRSLIMELKEQGRRFYWLAIIKRIEILKVIEYVR